MKCAVAFAATNIAVNEAIEQNRILPDFLSRIDNYRLNIPPLRERKDDIEFLANKFIDEDKHNDKELSDDAIEYLKSRTWPTNARQLKNFIKTAVRISKMNFITRSVLEEVEIEREIKQPDNSQFNQNILNNSNSLENLVKQCVDDSVPLKEIIDSVQSTYINRLKETHNINNKRKLAKLTGYSRTKVYRIF